jgi:type IV pilus assembly protein PilO
MNLDQILSDFRQLDPNDPGVWPAIPRAVVLIALLLAVVAGGWWLDWRDKENQLENAQTDEAKLKDEWLTKKRQAFNLEEYSKQLAEMDRQFGALLKQLPNKSEMENLIIDINQAGRGRGLNFELWKPGAETVKDFYAELPIQISVTGSYHALGQFVGDVAKQPRIVTLRDVMLTPAKDGVQIKLDASAVTYRYLDDEEISKQRRAKAAADKKK